MNGNCGSQNNVYIGARYVPKIVGEWSADIAYEPLTVVLYQGTSYTSRTYVPKGIIPSESTQQYWALTGNYNAQVEMYRQEVERLYNDYNGLKPRISRTYNTTIEMLNDNTLANGEYVETLGYYQLNDGGGAIFKIEDEISNQNYQINKNELYFTLIDNGTINILKCGANSTDDISDLINLLININKKIYIPKGNYNLQKTINISDKRFYIYGEGSRKTLINYKVNSNQPMFNKTSTNELQYCYIKGVGFLCSVSGLSVGTSNQTIGIKVTYMPYTTLNDVWFREFDTAVDMQSNGYCTNFIECSFTQCNKGITSGSEWNAIKIDNCKFLYCKIGYYSGNGRGQWITDTLCERCETGLYINNNGDKHIERCYFEVNDKDIEVVHTTFNNKLVTINNCVSFSNKETIFVDITDNLTLLYITNNYLYAYEQGNIQTFHNNSGINLVPFVDNNLNTSTNYNLPSGMYKNNRNFTHYFLTNEYSLTLKSLFEKYNTNTFAILSSLANNKTFDFTNMNGYQITLYVKYEDINHTINLKFSDALTITLDKPSSTGVEIYQINYISSSFYTVKNIGKQ